MAVVRLALVVGTALFVSACSTLGAAGSWERVPDDEADLGGPGNQEISDVTRGGPGLVAVGGERFEGESTELPMPGPAVWVSFDGREWERVRNPGGVFVDGWMEGVTVGGPGLVAVGRAGCCDAAVWVSPDGFDWQRVEDPGGVFDDAWMKAITVGGPGLVAVGQAEANPVVWVSPDGYEWERVTVPGIDGDLTAVTAGGPGLVAVGFGGVWVSPDGYKWERVTLPESEFGPALTAVTAGGPGVVAVGKHLVPFESAFGSGLSGDPSVWVSTDGFDWERVALPGAELGTAGGVFAVTAGGPGLVATGWGWDGTFDFDHTVWVSADGYDWDQVKDPQFFGTARKLAITKGGPGLVVVGWDYFSATDIDAAVWVWSPDEP